MYCESQAKSENSFNHTSSCVYCAAFSDFWGFWQVDHKMINLSVVWLIMQSDFSYVYVLLLYMYMLMTMYCLLNNKS